jgi:hypothetical protein
MNSLRASEHKFKTHIHGIPSEVQEGRERMEMTKVSNIKMIGEELKKNCEERMQVWK